MRPIGESVVMRGFQSGSSLAALLLVACGQAPAAPEVAPSYYGTLEPFASEAVYFVITDRFVNGDTDNDHRDQGGEHPTFDIPIECPDGMIANIGYLGGDFRGLVDNASYIRDMGFSTVWITPIVDNPDQAFSGGDEISCGSSLTDRGKTGYHGYWGMNFYRVDEHLESPGLAFADLTRGLRDAGLKTMLDLVANHSSPSWSMPVRQPGFGQVFDADGQLIADHGNLPPSELDPEGNPLHRFYNTAPDLAQLGDFDPANTDVMDYLVGAYLQWIGQGADALRVDTLRHQPLEFWREFTARIRAEHPDMFFLGEAFDYEAANLGPFTWPENGGISVLDFAMKAALTEVFENEGSDFARLAETLRLENGPYHDPYVLGSFYDNHDMARMNASDAGFINAHHWLFTARGIPVVYYGSETGFMRGRAEHAGNRNYFGQARIDAAPAHAIHQALTRIARLRRESVALQRGLQLNVRLERDEAVFYRVYQHAGEAQTALVMLNKGVEPATYAVTEYLESGTWRDGFSDETIEVGTRLEADVLAHGVRVFFLDSSLTRADTLARLDQLMTRKRRAQ